MKYMKSVLLLVMIISLTACELPGLGRFGKGETIKVTGGVTSETQILAGIVKALIEHETGLKVEIINNLATTTVNHQAMIQGDADISAARYTGTDLTGTLGLPPVKDPEEAFRIVSKTFEERFNQRWFPSYGFDNTYAFMVTRQLAEQYQLTKISDLKAIANQLIAGVDTSWINRDGDGYDEFVETYGIDFKEVYPMQIGLVYDALSANKMDIVLGYSTDGRINSYDLIILEDDLHFFPPYDASLVVKDELLNKYPELAPILERLKESIDTKTMQHLNYMVDHELIEPNIVAIKFLEKHHYFEGGE